MFDRRSLSGNDVLMDSRERLVEAGEWLKATRQEKGMSVRQLAAEIDVATQVIYDWQNGKNAVSEDNAAKIAQAFEMDLIQVRRNLGLWVPDDPGTTARGTREQAEAAARNELDELQRLLDEAQQRLERLRAQGEE